VADNKISVELEVTGNAEKNLDKVSDSVSNLEKTFKNGLSSAGASYEVFKGVLEAAAVEKVIEVTFEAAHKLFELFVVDGVKSAIESEVALNRLNQSLAISGEYSEEASKNFVDFADAMEEATTFSDDQILTTGALIESLAELSEEGLEQATTAAANLAQQLGVDLETAARKLGAAAEGNVASLKRYGITVEEGATKSETFAAAVQAINDKFGGSAQQATKTYAGSVAQLTNSFDDLIKVSGESVVKNNVVIAVFSAVNKILSQLKDAAEENQDSLKQFVGEGVIVAIDATVAFAATLDALYRVGVATFNGIRAGADAFGLGLTTAFGGPLALIDEFLSKLPGIGDKFGGLSKQIQETAVTLSNDLQDSLGKVGDAVSTGPTAAYTALEERVLKVRQAAVEGMNAMREGVSTTIEPINQAKKAVDELTQSQIALGQEGEKLAEQAAAQDPAAEYERRTEALKASLDQQLIDIEQYNNAVAVFQEESVRKQDELTAKQVDKLRAANDALIADSQRLHQAEIDGNNDKIKALLANETLSSQQRLALQKKLSDDSTKIDQGRVQAGQDAFGQLAQFQNAKTKEVAAVGKAAAIAGTIISTYEGASKAASALAGIPVVGPVLAGVAAAAFIASGLARVAMISGVQLASGIDEVPGVQTNRDSFGPVFLQPGERVVPTETNKDLKSFLADSGGVADILTSISLKLDKLQNHVIVNIGSKEIINELNDAMASGRVLA
jgi:hypothetical protein